MNSVTQTKTTIAGLGFLLISDSLGEGASRPYVCALLLQKKNNAAMIVHCCCYTTMQL
jgi:tRNA A22 N-methylase